MMASYEYWKNALKGEFGEVHDGQCQLGFWRRRMSSGGTFVPVATWEHGGQIVAMLDDRGADPAEIWSHICRYPVSEEHYRERIATGKWWDEDTAMVASLEPPRGMGDNQPPTDPLEILKDQIASAMGGVGEYGRIDTDEAAARAQGLRSRLLELSGEAEKHRVKLKQPHLDAGRAVDEAWNPLVKEARGGADSLRAAISAHETRVLKARQEAEAERVRAERQRAKEAEDARLAAIASGQPAPEPELPTAPPSAPMEPAQTQVRGAYGRAASKKVVKKARVTDYVAATTAMATHPELKALVDKLAQRAVDAGVTVPGVEFEEVIDVR